MARMKGQQGKLVHLYEGNHYVQNILKNRFGRTGINMQNAAAKLTMNMYWLSYSSAVGSLCIMTLAFALLLSFT